MSKNYLDTKQFINVVYNEPLDFGRFWFYLLSQLNQLSSYEHYYIYRLPSLTLALLSLFFLQLIMRKLNFNYVSSIGGLFLFTFWSLYGANGISLRPESMYMFSTILSIYAGVIFKDKKIGKVYFLSLIINFISFSMHPNGIFGFLINLFTLIYYRKIIKLKYLLLLIPVGCVGLILFYVSLTWDSTLQDFVNGYMYNANTSFHKLPFYREYQRYFDLFNAYPLVVPFILIALISLFFKSKSELEKIIKYIFFISLIYLLLLPVKWHYYFSVAIPSVSILFAYVLESSPRITFNNKTYSINYLVLLVLFVNIGIYQYSQAKEYTMLRSQIHKEAFWQDAVIKQVKNEVSGKKIAAPTVFFPYLDQSLFVPYNEFGEIKFIYRSALIKPDYLITTLKDSPEEIMKNYSIQMEYKRAIYFQGIPYNLYAIK
ncbi:hypothetical protein O9H85_29725 [Paenibacillus filicis]|uniref:Glycosyltransferase RgtA/B/C/D-like domain-containing protein n=1 Tax=Paenibacillus gyeongsangnamensis TaxID=3388067 RepID=A0ABT4QI09_9BACL|nr:hypothetical protein [Paenibacillus filicis]MCZ8516494.1 hypothetical protein [Paenibacillus filicis]